MKKRICLFLAALLLTGCTLADPDQEDSGPNRLMGVFVTEEHLSLEEERLYADVKPDESGVDTLVEFPSLEGYLLAWYEDEDGWVTTNDSYEFSEYHRDRSVNGEIRSDSITAAICVDEAVGEVCLFVNPVYQDGQGRVYLTAGTGISGSLEHGGQMKYELSDEYQTTELGKPSGWRTDAEITVKGVTLPEKYVFKSMNESYQVIGVEEYTPDELSEKVVVEDKTQSASVFAELGASIMLVECHYPDGTIERTICALEDERVYVDVYIPLQDGICTKRGLRVSWFG